MDKVKGLFVWIGVCMSLSAYSQIEYRPLSWVEFRQDGERIKFREVERMMQSSPDAYQYLQRGKQNRTLSIITASGALALEMYSVLGRLEAREQSRYQVGGLVLACASLVFDLRHNIQFRKATNSYNRDTGMIGFQLNPVVSTKGVGLQITF